MVEPPVERARALLAPFLSALHRANSHIALLHLLCSEDTRGDFAPRRSWLCANFDAARATAVERRQLRAFAEVVGRLSASAALSWRDCYAAFWKPVLVAPLACGSYRRIFAHTPYPTEYDASAQLLASAGPRLMLDLSKTSDVGEKLRTLRAFLFADPAEALGEQAARDLAEIASSNSSSARMPRMELGLVLSSCSLTTSELRAFASVLAEFAAREQRKTAQDGVVQFEVAALWVSLDRALSPVDMEILGDMVANETAIVRELRITTVSLQLAEVDQAFNRFVRHAVCCMEGHTAWDSRRGLQSLELHGAPMAYGHIVSLCSALRYRNSLVELTMDWGSGRAFIEYLKMDLMWAWIAYGVFHADSQARLDNLVLPGWPIRRTDMDAFESVFRSPLPGRQIWILEHGDLPQGKGMDEVSMPLGQRVLLELKAKTKVRSFPKQRSTVVHQTASRDQEQLEAVILLESWACVVVPAFGLSWIPTASIVTRRYVPSKSYNRAITASNVKSFHGFTPRDNGHGHHSDDENIESDLPFLSDAFDTVKFLLQMIGLGLEGLTFPLHGINISELDLAEILDLCPNLRQLNLKENHLSSFSPLVDRYHAQKCRIVSLSVDSSCRDAHVIAQLAGLLASPSSKLLWSVEVNKLVDLCDCFEQLGEALATNNTLELLSVYIGHSDNGDGILNWIQEQQHRVIGSKFPLPMKIAFLSAIHAHASRSPSDPRFTSFARLGSANASTKVDEGRSKEQMALLTPDMDAGVVGGRRPYADLEEASGKRKRRKLWKLR